MKMYHGKWKVTFCAALCLLFLVSFRSILATADDTDFEIKDGVLLKYHGTSENVVIPDYVTSIGELAFQDCSVIKQIAIPNSVTSIGNRAFMSCIGLTKVILPDSITSIGKEAFSNCIALTEVTLPLNLKSIPYGLFRNCTTLNKIFLPTGMTSIEAYAFERCSSLENLIIPNSLTTIGDYAFLNSGLIEITIPDSVTNIGEKVIDGTPWLKDQQTKNPLVIANNILLDASKCRGKVSIPSYVTNITAKAFYQSQISSITMGEQVSTIGQEAFAKCVRLTNVKLSNHIEKLENKTFFSCYNLKRINFPKYLKSIGDYCFDSCSSLEGTITLPNELTTLGSGCFNNCSNITDFVFPISLTEIKEYPMNGTAWDANQNEDFVIINQILCRVAKYNLKEHSGCMVLPNTIKKILPYAFQKSRMTSIVIPKSVQNIGHHAFKKTIFLEQIIIPANTVLEEDVFQYSAKDLTIFSVNNSKAKKYASENGIKFETIGFQKTKYTIVKGRTLKLSLNCLANCSWSSSNSTIASVNAKGVVTGKKPGTVTITAKLYGRKYNCTVTVK